MRDANRHHFEAGFFESRLGLTQEFHSLLNLFLVVGAVQAHERGDGTHFRLCGSVGSARGKRYCENHGDHAKRGDQGYGGVTTFARAAHENAAIPVMRSPMISLWMSWVPS